MGTRTFLGGIAFGAVSRREVESVAFAVNVLCRGGVTVAKGMRAAKAEAVTGERVVEGWGSSSNDMRIGDSAATQLTLWHSHSRLDYEQNLNAFFSFSILFL